MQNNFILYAVLSAINVHIIYTFTPVTSSKTDNAILIYPGQVNKYFSCKK